MELSKRELWRLKKIKKDILGTSDAKEILEFTEPKEVDQIIDDIIERFEFKGSEIQKLRPAQHLIKLLRQQAMEDLNKSPSKLTAKAIQERQQREQKLLSKAEYLINKQHYMVKTNKPDRAQVNISVGNEFYLLASEQIPKYEIALNSDLYERFSSINQLYSQEGYFIYALIHAPELGIQVALGISDTIDDFNVSPEVEALFQNIKIIKDQVFKNPVKVNLSFMAGPLIKTISFKKSDLISETDMIMNRELIGEYIIATSRGAVFIGQEIELLGVKLEINYLVDSTDNPVSFGFAVAPNFENEIRLGYF